MNENENQVPNTVPETVLDSTPETLESTENDPVQPRKFKKKRSLGRIISNVIFCILFIVILIEAILGFVNMNAIGEGKEPVWCLSQKEEENKNETITTYNLGLYKIVKIENEDKVTTTLKPFFMN